MFADDTQKFPQITKAYRETIQPGNLTLGLVVPIEVHGNRPVSSLGRHVERVQLTDELGVASLGLRDVPFSVPSFGDAGQTF